MTISIKDNLYVNTPSKGNQIKFKNSEDNKWYKADFLGYEAAAEVATSDILSQSNISYPFVKYELEEIEFLTRMGKKKIHGCSSPDFLNPGESIITVQHLIEKIEGKSPAEVLKNKSTEDKIKYTVDLVEKSTGIKDFGKYLTSIIELDAFIYNEDRHFNNIAIVEDNEGCFRPCPIFDNGASFLSDIKEYSGDRIGLLRKAVLSKPFSESFNEQLQVCREIYGPQLTFYKTLALSNNTKNSINQVYGMNVLDRIENTLNFSKTIHPEMISCVSLMNNNSEVEEDQKEKYIKE